jgi:hypothetical protein
MLAFVQPHLIQRLLGAEYRLPIRNEIGIGVVLLLYFHLQGQGQSRSTTYIESEANRPGSCPVAAI